MTQAAKSRRLAGSRPGDRSAGSCLRVWAGGEDVALAKLRWGVRPEWRGTLLHLARPLLLQGLHTGLTEAEVSGVACTVFMDTDNTYQVP